MSYACHLKHGELGVIVIALNSMTPVDADPKYQKAFTELRERLTLAWSKQDPQAYEHYVAHGDVEAFTPPALIRYQEKIAAYQIVDPLYDALRATEN